MSVIPLIRFLFRKSNAIPQPFYTALRTRNALVMARKPPCLFLKRLVVICCLTKPFLRPMASGNSVHSAGINEIHQVPINVINRPIIPVLEEEKVRSLMKTIQVSVCC